MYSFRCQRRKRCVYVLWKAFKQKSSVCESLLKEKKSTKKFGSYAKKAYLCVIIIKKNIITMKKIILSLVAVFAFGAVSAQNLVSSKGEQYLPKQGDWSIGFNAGNALKYVGNAFNGNQNNSSADLFEGQRILNFGDGTFSSTASVLTFVGKKFDADNKATRYTASFNFNFEKQKDVDATTKFGLVLGYGKEWRKGTTRLQGYYGADALVGLVSPAKKQFGFGIGAQGFAGVEYFIFPKVALGAQYTYGVSFEYASNDSNNKMGFNIGSSNGLGVLSATVNAYF